MSETIPQNRTNGLREDIEDSELASVRNRGDLERYERGVESLSEAVMWHFLAWMTALTLLMVVALVVITHRNIIYDW